MVEKKGRVIKPPLEPVVSGRVFKPSPVLMLKKWLKVFILVLLGWIAIWAVLFSNAGVQAFMLLLSEPLEIFVNLGWTQISIYYWLGVGTLLAIAALYIYAYVSRIEYSVRGWEGEAMPEVAVTKGIINITKKFVPFRTIVFLRTRRGPFDRLLGIGNVMVETAGGEAPQQGGGFIALLIYGFSRSATEERIEGIRFHEELRDFILQQLRGFGRTPFLIDRPRRTVGTSRILNRETLVAFQEIRDALVDRQRAAIA